MLRKSVFYLITLSLVFSTAPTLLQAASHPIAVDSGTFERLIVTVKWGNVRGEPETKEKTSFDGSLTVSNGEVGVIRPLLFEHHDDLKDRLTSRANPVSWTSWIYGHWDGVRAVVAAEDDETLTVTTEAGSLSVIISQLKASREPIIQELPGGREIIIKANPHLKRHFIVKAYWGDPYVKENIKARLKKRVKALRGKANEELDHLERRHRLKKLKEMGEHLRKEELIELERGNSSTLDMQTANEKSELIDFTGSLSALNGARIKFKKALRFEEEQGDRITSQTEEQISWQSFIAGGVDGVKFRADFERGQARDDKIKITFKALDWSQEFSLAKLYAKRLIKERIVVGDQVYLLVLEVHHRPFGKLLRDKRNGRVFRLEDDILRPVLSPAAFQANGFSWQEVEDVDDVDELEGLAVGEPVEFPDGALIKARSQPAVYVASEGCLRPFIHERVFKKLGFSFKNVVELPDGDVKAFPVCEMVTDSSEHPNGVLLRARGTAGVYQIRGGRKHAIRDRKIFDSHRLKFNYVLEVDPQVLTKYQLSSDLEPAEGALIQPVGSKRVFIIEGGQRRWITNEEEFHALKLKFDDVIKLSDEKVVEIKEAEIIAGEE